MTLPRVKFNERTGICVPSRYEEMAGAAATVVHSLYVGAGHAWEAVERAKEGISPEAGKIGRAGLALGALIGATIYIAETHMSEAALSGNGTER